MDIGDSTSAAIGAVQTAVQQRLLEQMKTQAVGVLGMLAPPLPTGSVNLPSQGTLLDVRV